MVQIIKLITIFIHSNHSEKRMCWGSVSFLSQISGKYRCVSSLVSVWLLFTKLAWNMFFCSCPRNLKCNNFEFCFTARLTILKSEKVYSWPSKINLLNLKMIQIQRRACVFCCRCRKWWNVQKNEPFLTRVHSKSYCSDSYLWLVSDIASDIAPRDPAVPELVEWGVARAQKVWLASTQLSSQGFQNSQLVEIQICRPQKLKLRVLPSRHCWGLSF